MTGVINSGSGQDSSGGGGVHPLDSFAAANRGFIAKMRAYLYRRLPSEEAAQEVAAETMMAFAAYVPGREFSEQELFKVLYGIANKQIVNFWRKDSRDREKFNNLIPFLTHKRDPSAVYALRCDVRGALEALPEKQRRVLELRYLDGFTAAEAAKIMGISTSYVTQLTGKAMEAVKLSGRLRGYHGSEWDAGSSETSA
jgi:RNA polymerase sigma-70 factor (ECF subfamily)